MRRSADTIVDSGAIQRDLDSDWRHAAECLNYVGLVDFFPARGESARDAKAICGVCPVREDCLEYAMRWELLHGVWGGLSERERRQLRRERKGPRRQRI
jgi:WhiB family redox-sensing transcriptional regulator